jgi:hypothetical protein
MAIFFKNKSTKVKGKGPKDRPKARAAAQAKRSRVVKGKGPKDIVGTRRKVVNILVREAKVAKVKRKTRAR